MGRFDAFRDLGEIMQRSGQLPRTGVADGLKMANQALGDHLDDRRLQVHGLPGTGRLISSRALAPAPNGAPQTELTVEVTVLDREPYQVTMVRLVDAAMAGAVFPGDQAPVLVDPNDPQTVVIHQQGMMHQAAEIMAMGQASAQRSAQAAQQTPTDRLARLADLRDRGLLTEEEFAAQKARILGEL